MQKIIEDMKFKTYDEVKPELDKLKEEEKADALKVGRKEGIAAGKMLGLYVCYLQYTDVSTQAVVCTKR